MLFRLLGATVIAAGLACAAEASGYYVLVGVHEVGSELMLKRDGTFEYVFIYGAADYHAKGKWRQDGNAVVLTADGAGEKPFRMTNATKGPAGEFRVFVKGPNGRGVEHIDVAVKTSNGMVEGRTNADGVARFADVAGVRAVALRVPVYDVEDGPYDVGAGQTELTFEINGEAITQVPFKDERLAMAEGGLEMRFWNRDRVMRYRKQ